VRSSAAIIRELSAAGATSEIIAIAIDALDELRAEAAADLAAALDKLAEAVDRPRRKERERKAKQRAPAVVPGQSRDSPDPSRDNDGTERDSPGLVSPDKKTPPNPPKELTPSAPPATRGREARRPHRLPDDWQPQPFTPGTEAASITAVWPPGQLEREAARFRDHWAADGTRYGLKSDWQAAFREWIRRTDERERWHNGRGKNNLANRGEPRVDPALVLWRAATAEVEAEETAGQDHATDFGAGLAIPPERARRY
jgi:hypothetical protein